MPEHGIFSLKPDLRLEWRGQGGHHEIQKPDHSASLGDSVTSSTRIGFSVHTRRPSGRALISPIYLACTLADHSDDLPVEFDANILAKAILISAMRIIVLKCPSA